MERITKKKAWADLFIRLRLWWLFQLATFGFFMLLWKRWTEEIIDICLHGINHFTERKRDISRFIQIVGKYSDIQELTYENVHEFIDRILIHELDRETNTRKIEIHYSFVGQVDTEQEPTQVVNHDRRNMVDVKSIAI